MPSDLGDYATAATYFNRLVPFYAETGWDLVETLMLERYAASLRHLDRKEEFVRILIELLAKAVAAEKQIVARRAGGVSQDASKLSYDASMSTDAHVRDLLNYSKQLGQQVVIPMERIFADIQVPPYPRQCEEKDGFQLQLGLRYLIQTELEVQSVKLRIIGTAGIQGREVWLEGKRGLSLKRGVVTSWLETNVRESIAMSPAII